MIVNMIEGKCEVGDSDDHFKCYMTGTLLSLLRYYYFLNLYKMPMN